jgi:hypothetical protein
MNVVHEQPAQTDGRLKDALQTKLVSALVASVHRSMISDAPVSSSGLARWLQQVWLTS